MLPQLSAEVDLNFSMPSIPRKASSILIIIPSSTSKAEAPGNGISIFTSSRSILGLILLCICESPNKPAMQIIIITQLVTTECLIKYCISFDAIY